MPPDRSPRSVPFAGSPLHPPSSRNNNTGRPHRLTLTAENALVPPAGYAPLQPSAASTSDLSGDGRSIQSPPWLADHSHGNLVLNYIPHSQHLIVGQGPPFLLSTPQPERNNLLLPQAAQPCINPFIAHPRMASYPAQLLNQHYSIGPPRQASYLGTLLSEQQWSTTQSPHHPLTPHPSHLQYRGPDPFYKAHDFVIKDPVFVSDPTFLNKNIFVDSSSDNFMASFLKETIPGAEFDSSDCHMPLRCHPGTRLEIIKRCQDFVLNRDGRAKIRWVVGAAGVGKSAIMQSVAHDSNVLSEVIVGATVFFSINGRQDGTKAIPTIAFQLATRLKSYRLFVQREIARDPTLYRKSLSRQFNKFIVEPFIHERILDVSSQLLIIIDGLDECANPLIQQELLGLISFFCIKYPTSPIVWMIASRPEHHITSFFAQPRVACAYEKEEILVDSDEACEDVRRYLRDKFREVKKASIPLQELSQWPSEANLLKIANASGGLFAYASTVVRYISDPDYGDPVPLLNDVLDIIETGSKKNIWGRNHPMAQLDALYSHIMSRIPNTVMADTRKLLLHLSQNSWPWYQEDLSFQTYCNFLGMTLNAVYGALHHIRSIADVPVLAQTSLLGFSFFHKSFPDYLRDFERSGFSPDIESESQQLIDQCALRILEESPNGLYMDHQPNGGLSSNSGALENDSRTCDTIAVSWPATEEHENNRIKFTMFRMAVGKSMAGIYRGDKAFQSLLCLRVLTTCFTKLPVNFPFDAMRDLVFDESRRHKLLEHGILKEVSLETLDYDAITIDLHLGLCFRGPIAEGSNPWNLSCQHKRKGSWDGHDQDWLTTFGHPDAYTYKYKCRHCFERFTRHFNTRSMGQLVTVLDLTPTLRLVELRFVDPDDGVSDWTYHFFTGDIGDFDIDEYAWLEDSSEEG